MKGAKRKLSTVRKSNTTVGGADLADTGSSILLWDVNVQYDTWCLHLAVPQSKTNQAKNRARSLLLQGVKGHALDPVQAWLDHVRVKDPPQTCPAFTDSGAARPHVALTHSDLVTMTKRAFARMSKDESSVSGHSFRRGGCSFVFLSGVNDVLIQRQGGWKLQTYRPTGATLISHPNNSARCPPKRFNTWLAVCSTKCTMHSNILSMLCTLQSVHAQLWSLLLRKWKEQDMTVLTWSWQGMMSVSR